MATKKEKSRTGGSEPLSAVLPISPPLWNHHRTSLERSLRSWKESGNIPPVLLLTGPSGIGKRQVAYHLAQVIFCTESGLSSDGSQTAENVVPCGHCVSCHKATTGNWIDFTEISSDSEDGEATATSSSSLKTEQFRELKSQVGFSAYEGRYKITLIRDADRMTVQAANSLLKILEEPPPGWIFFLTASDSSSLLPTLISRCQIIRLRPLPQETLQMLLEEFNLSPERKNTLAQIAEGSMNRAFSLALDEAWESREDLLRFFANPGAELSALVDWGSSEPKKMQLLLDLFEQALSDLIKWSLSPEKFPLRDPSLRSYAEAVQRRIKDIDSIRGFWIDRASRIFQARQESFTPMNKKLLLQDLLLPFAG